MDQYTIDDILERIDELIEILNEHEEVLYIPIEVAHQLRDEIEQIDTSSDYDNE